jgi:hypothetical protein
MVMIQITGDENHQVQEGQRKKEKHNFVISLSHGKLVFVWINNLSML